MHTETVNLRENSYPILIGEGGSLSLEHYEEHIAGKDIEEIKPRLGEEAATFILKHIILTTRDIRDPEETYEGD